MENSTDNPPYGQPKRPWAPLTSIPNMKQLPDLPAIQAGRYRHYKGGKYALIGVVRHSETLEPLVLYRALSQDSGLWVRPYAMFFEQVEVNGQWQPRFAPQAD